jgi:hypothetical protein
MPDGVVTSVIFTINESADLRRKSAVSIQFKTARFLEILHGEALALRRRRRSVNQMMLRSSMFVAVLALMLACGRSPAAPSNPAAVLSGSVASTLVTPAGTSATPASVRGREDFLVNMQDACDQATFDAAIGPGTCVRAGGMQFSQFVAQLTRLGFVGAWHFAPPTANVRVGQTFVASNNGGEVHTFTEVAKFGGGIVPFLNDLAHVPVVAPECGTLEPDDFIAPGGTYREGVDRAGTLKFQCCIHPWMRLEATASSR